MNLYLFSTNTGRTISSTLVIIFFIFAGTLFSGEREAVNSDHDQKSISAINEGQSKPSVLSVGGGTHHDFERWFNLEDSKIMWEAGAMVRYTDDPAYVGELLGEIDILYLNTNQPLSDDKLRQGIFDFVDSGKGLLIGHAGNWYNWSDWPEYNRELVSGGARSHPPYQEIEFEVVNSNHPITEGVPQSFRMQDELYRFENDPKGPEMNVLVKGIEPESGDEFPVVWTVEREGGRIVCYTFGHDGKAHYHYAYRTILKNSIEWLTDK